MIWYICSNWSLGNETLCIKKGSIHLHTNTCGIGFWFIFYYLWQNAPCTRYFCTEGKADYGLSWRNFWNTWYCCLHPSRSKKGYFATRAHRFLGLPKVSCPLVCSAASSRARKLTGRRHPVDPRRFGVVLVLVFGSHWLSEHHLLHWAVCMPCIIYDYDVYPSAFTCITCKGGIRLIRDIAFHVDLLMGGRLQFESEDLSAVLLAAY